MQETQETWVRSLGWEDPLEKGMAITPVFLPGEFYGQGSLVGCSPWGHKKLDTTEWLTLLLLFFLHLICNLKLIFHLIYINIHLKRILYLHSLFSYSFEIACVCAFSTAFWGLVYIINFQLCTFRSYQPTNFILWCVEKNASFFKPS